MRPIDHPPQPAANVYPTFRLDTLAHLDDDLDTYPWTTTSGIPWEFFDRTRAEGLFASDALRETLLELILHPPPPTPKGGKRKRADVTLSDVTHYAALFRDRVYPEANEPLYDTLGRYCSYCEQALTETIAVEHVAPKASYPMTSVCWFNFLLSCRSCNSRKDEQPARDVAWMPGPGDEVALYDAIRNHYLLPDTSPDAYTSLRPALYANTGAGYKFVDINVSVSDGLVLVDKGKAGTKAPKAQVPFTTGTATADVLVRLVPTAPSLAPAQASFAMLGFENTGIGSSDDNRMWDRTNKWLLAVKEFRKLANTNDFATQWDSLCELAGETGFLTTWIRVLHLRGGAAAPYPAPPGLRTSYLLPQFLQQMTQGQNPPYPNTDLNCLP